MRKCADTLESELTPGELAALTDLLRGAGLTGRHLEIGTAAGGTLKEMMAAYPAGARPPFVAIDPMTYFEDQPNVVRVNLASRGIDASEVDFRVAYSWPEYAKAAARGERYQFMLIDGDHSARGVIHDLVWTRLLDVGGYVCLHDVAPLYTGVMWAVKRFLASVDNYETVAHVEKLLILRKTGQAKRPEVSGFHLATSHLANLLLKWQRSIQRRLAGR